MAGTAGRSTLAALALAAALGAGTARAANPAPDGAAVALESAAVEPARGGAASRHDGVVEAVRQTVIAAQVPALVTALAVKAGDRVRGGQVLVRLDARAAEQVAAAGAAQVQAAQAALDAATRELERQRQLFEKRYISQGALDRAEADFRSAEAQARAQIAAAGAARTQSGFYLMKAPYDGIVSRVDVVQGDMAMPGRPLLTMYDPGALRVTAAVPQTVAATAQAASAAVALEIPGALPGRLVPARVQWLPAADPSTHTVELRLALPADAAAAPGSFARAFIEAGAGGPAGAERLTIPSSAVLRRAELDGVYVIGADGRALLRQVRVGRRDGDRTEVLAGLAAGERVALDPQAAARQR